MQKSSKIKKSKGFTIIESILYIFLTTIILLEGINLVTINYKAYLENKNISIDYDEMQDFYINLDCILREEEKENIETGDNYLLINREMEEKFNSKMIIKENKSLVVKYIYKKNTISTNRLLLNVSDFKVIKKGNLIYTIITKNNGKEFIRCI